MRHAAALAVSALLLAGTAVGPGAGPAAADQGPGAGVTGGGYTTSVAIRFSGDAAPSSSRSLRVAPSCWWQPAPGPYRSAAGMLDWYDRNAGAVPDRYSRYQYGDRSQWARAADAERRGRKVAWYRAVCRKASDYEGFVNSDLRTFAPDERRIRVLDPFRAFGVGDPIPPPLVAPEDLARAARDVMVIPVPVVRRNPRLRSPGAPTLVGLPTWFWVPDAAAVGGAGGTRTIRAEVGPVWAEVVARTSGLRVSSPAGGTLCRPARAVVAYTAGVPDADACTVSFSRSSTGYPGGYAVTAATAWQATWTGSGGASGTLPPLARARAMRVPVAEVQNVVTR